MIVENGQYIVYCHTNKINGKKYIGQIKLSPERRWGKNGCNYSGSRHFFGAIQKYGWNNFDHEIIASNLTLEEANNFESLLIQKLNTQNPNKGYNIAFGGDNKEPSEETKKLWKEQRSGGNHPNAKKVICDNIVFDCIGDCASYYNVNRRLINSWLLRELPMPQDFIDKQLRFEEDIIPHSSQVGGKKSVICDDVVYNTIIEFAKMFNLKQNNVSRWLSGQRKMPQEWKDRGLAYYKGGG